MKRGRGDASEANRCVSCGKTFPSLNYIEDDGKCIECHLKEKTSDVHAVAKGPTKEPAAPPTSTVDPRLRRLEAAVGLVTALGIVQIAVAAISGLFFLAALNVVALLFIAVFIAWIVGLILFARVTNEILQRDRARMEELDARPTMAPFAPPAAPKKTRVPSSRR